MTPNQKKFVKYALIFAGLSIVLLTLYYGVPDFKVNTGE
jgi:hypothetical protein